MLRSAAIATIRYAVYPSNNYVARIRGFVVHSGREEPDGQAEPRNAQLSLV